MAVARPITDEQGWADWVASRPPKIQQMAVMFPPDRLYRMPDGYRGTITSYNEDGTVAIALTGQFNRILFSRKVFGVDPSTLVECDLPGPDEDLGDTAQEAGYSQEDIETILIPKMRELREQRLREQ
jgi:hypothetical protein